MPKEEYVSNDSFMTSQVKTPRAFGNDYEDPLEALKASIAEKQKSKSANSANVEVEATHPPTNAPTHPPTNQPTHQYTHPPTQKVEYPISADRDFSKMPNSIKRALEQGWFINSSFQVYYYLFNLTRTAIKARRIVQVPKAQLLIGSGLKADKALLENIAYLESIGLIVKSVRSGDKKGNLYEVFRPEEVPLGDIPPTHLRTNPPTNIPTNVGHSSTHLPAHFNDVGGWVQTTENDTSYNAPKTSFKDNIRDDDDMRRVNETFLMMAEKFSAAVKKITGKDVSKNDSAKWSDLADLLILELEVAASRTGNVSSVPAFLTEVLRRQFFAAQRESVKTSAKQPKRFIDAVGKASVDASADSFEIKPLDEKGREAALYDLQEFANDPELLEGFEKWYTPEDWQWITEHLEKPKI